MKSKVHVVFVGDGMFYFYIWLRVRELWKDIDY